MLKYKAATALRFHVLKINENIIIDIKHALMDEGRSPSVFLKFIFNNPHEG